MKLYTTRQAAGILGNHIRTVQGWCELFGYRKTGRDWILTEDQLDRIRSRIRSAPGRPRKS